MDPFNKDNIETVINIGDTKYLNILLSRHRISSKDALGNPYLGVCSNGHVEMAKLLATKGLDFQKFRSDDGMSCMHFAVKKNQIKMVQYLLEKDNG